MLAVHREDAEFTFRTICRWYSQRYSTPLHEVGTIDGKVTLEEALRTFYEVRYQEMDEQKCEAEIALLLRTPEEEREASLAEDAREADNWGFARMVERQVIAKKEKELEAQKKEKLEEAKVTSVDTDGGRILTNKPIREVQMPTGVVQKQAPTPPAPSVATLKHAPVDTKLPEGERIVFMTPEEMEADAQDPFSVVKAPRRPSRK
jgi:hypothetical protein